MQVRTERFPSNNFSVQIITPNKWYFVEEVSERNSDGVPRYGVIRTNQGHRMRIVLDGPCPWLDEGYWDVDWYD